MRTQDDSDATLVARVRAGDPEAFPLLYDRHAPLVRAIVRARLGSQADPEDAVQDVFAAAWAALDRLRDGERLRPWLGQIARRTAIDHGRRARRAPIAADEVLAGAVDPRPRPDDEVVGRDLALRLAQGVRALSPRDARAVALAHRGPEAVARALGVRPATAKVVVHRARRRLRATVAA